MIAALVGLGAFLIGSFPTGLLVARARGVDLRRVGSGNIGATNTARALGRRWGVLVLLVDAAKGAGPALAARALGLGAWEGAAVALAAVLGHVFSVFLGGRGGKGVATAFGAALALAPVPALTAFGVWVALYAAVRISSVGSLAAVAAFPLLVWLIGSGEPPVIAFGAAAAVVVIARHHENLRRLVRGEEHRAP